jgi:hypothetical protein
MRNFHHQIDVEVDHLFRRFRSTYEMKPKILTASAVWSVAVATTTMTSVAISANPIANGKLWPVCPSILHFHPIQRISVCD